MPNVFANADNQWQRKANAFEKFLNVFQIPNQVMAGAADALVRHDNPILGAQDYMAEHKTWQDFLENRGFDKATSTVGGLAIDIFSDPSTYIAGPGLTKIGKLARASTVMADMAKMAEAGYDVSKVLPPAEKLGATMAEQAALKQRALVSFADRPIIYGEKVFGIAEDVAKSVGNSLPGRTFKQIFQTMPGVPEAMKLRNRMRAAAISRDIHDLELDITPVGKAYYDAMKGLGVEPEDAKHILRDAVELNSKFIGNTNLTEHMDDATKLKYYRWTGEAESVKRGLTPEFTSGARYGGQRSRPGIGAERTFTEHDIERETIAAGGRKYPEQIPDQFGRKKKLKGVGGPVYPNVHGYPDSWDFAGRMPEELIQHLPENSRKAVRRAEDKAIAEYSAKKTSSIVSDVLSKYHGHDVMALHPVVQRAVDFINAANAAYLANERASGITISELISDVNYLRHALTPEAKELIAMLDKGHGAFANSYDISVRFGAQLQRDENLRNLTITQINELAQTGKLRLLDNKKIKLFEDEPFMATFIRGSESRRAIRAAEMARDAASSFGQKLAGTMEQPLTRANIPQGYDVLSDRLALDMGLRKVGPGGKVLEDVALPTEIAQMMERQYQKVITPAYLQPILRGYDSLQRIWKNTLLPIWPAYHARNMVSDLVLMTGFGADEYGVGIPNAIKSIGEVTAGLVGHGNDVDIGGQIMKWDEFKQLLDHYGMIDYTIGRDLDEGISRTYGLPRDLSGIQKFEEAVQMAGVGNLRPIDWAIRQGQLRQNAMNSGYFLALLRDGHSPEIAALEVKKRLFDFQDLTDTERQILRRVFPFYAWLRHNLPYQIHAAIRRPAIVGNIQKTREAMSGGEGPAGDVPLPEFLSGGMPMQFNVGMDMDPDKPNFVRLQGLLPMGDLALMDNPTELLVNQMTPWLKAPYEVGANYSTFEQQPLERFPGDSTKRLGLDVAKRWTPLIDMWRPIRELDQAAFKDNPVSSKIAGLGLTKSYPIDAQLQNGLMMYKLQQAEIEAKKMLFKAAKNGDTANVVRIRQWLQSIHENPAQLLQ